ncbi:hypothetical protein UCD39_07760 [Nitrospirillum sp. BR 11752]|nr:hypothetical protein [Nitrospirillum sp. BR 11752]
MKNGTGPFFIAADSEKTKQKQEAQSKVSVALKAQVAYSSPF